MRLTLGRCDAVFLEYLIRCTTLHASRPFHNLDVVIVKSASQAAWSWSETHQRHDIGRLPDVSYPGLVPKACRIRLSNSGTNHQLARRSTVNLHVKDQEYCVLRRTYLRVRNIITTCHGIFNSQRDVCDYRVGPLIFSTTGKSIETLRTDFTGSLIWVAME